MAEENKALRSVLQGNGEFTKNLYKVLARESGNVFFSPISIHAILSLASQGSANQTKAAFTEVLKVPDLKVAAEGYKDVMTHLNSVNDVTLLIANKLFLKENYKLQKEFNSIATEHFFAEVQLLDFVKSEAAAKSINDWVEEKTNNKIKDLIDSGDLDESTRDDETINVDMMHISEKFFYKNDENLDAKVLELPYVNNSLSLIVILPNKRNGISELEEKLAGTDLTKITENISLTEIGLGDIFSRNANFSAMLDSPEELYVSKVVQKAFIEVNEEGVEAAAATGAIKRVLRCANFPEKFIADSPFVVILAAKGKIHKYNGFSEHQLLFYGKITNPSDIRYVKHDELWALSMIMATRAAFLPMRPEEFRADHPFVISLSRREGPLVHQLFSGRVNKPQV
ncbi:hypothetical protein NQ318_019377 [Aromia moschata]|uniref:Serpin domain-containing protein n=1 Tax=Aromia moschata TaxID=1265417 RepID=A0AAV8XNM2_9CUCU|nr:hypothetical protein NQ318_019377 [Aromia moschata]